MKPPVPALGSSMVRMLCMRWLVLCVPFFLSLTDVVAQNAGLGTASPDPSALLDMVSTSQGLLVPRMTSAQRTAIATPANGLLVFDTDLTQFYYFSSGTGWVPVLSASSLNAAVILSPTTATRNVVQPTGIAITPLVLKGAVGQTASLLDVQNSGGTSMFSIGNDGSIQLRGSVSGTLSLRATSATTSYALVFPSAQAAGTLTNDGAGNLSWSTAGVTGSGTTNRLAKFTSTSQIGSSSLDDLYTGGTSATINALGNLGIGTLPTQRLDVAGNVRFSGSLMPNGTAGTTGQLLVSQGGSSAPVWQDASTLVINTSWSTTGNTGTNSSNNFLGTTDAQSLSIRTNNVERIRVSTSGNIGLGLVNPSQKLDVAGNVQFTGSLMPNGIAGTSGQLLVSQGGGSAPVWQNMSSLFNNSWSTTGNISTDPSNNFLGTADAQALSIRTNSVERIRVSTGGNIGIGLVNPSQKLDVAGNVQFTGSLMPNGTAGTTGQLLVSQGGGSAPIWQDAGTFIINNSWSTTGNIGTNPSSNFLGTADAQALAFRVGNIERMRLSTSGNLGLGLANPAEKLDVAGNIQFSGALLPNSTSGTVGQVLVSQGPGVAPTWQTPTTGSITGWSLTGNSGTSSSNFLGTTDNQPLILKTNGTEQMRVMQNGNVGIGTSTATRTLDVAGTARIGVSGTTITNIIRATVTNYDLIPVAGNSSTTVNFTVTGAAPGSTVMISPQNTLLNGLVISFARVSATDTVEMGVQNTTSISVDQGAMDFYITVIQ